MILPGGRLESAKIIDFGIAKDTDPTAATIVGNDFAGKFSYVSPEQLGMYGGQVDGRSDIYSLGLVLVAAALGESLDMGMSMISVVEARRAVPDLGRVPAELRNDLAAMLQPDPKDRPQTMAELIAAPPPAVPRPEPGQTVLTGGSARTPSRPPGTGGRAVLPEVVPAKPKRGALTGLMIAAAVLLVLGGGAVVLVLTPVGVQLRGEFQRLAALIVGPQVGPVTPPVTPRPDQPPVTPRPDQPPVTPRPDQPPVTPRPDQPPVTPRPDPPPAVDIGALRRSVNAIVAGFDCAALSATVSDDAGIAVSGFVARPDDLQRLQTQLAVIPQAGRQRLDVVTYEWPFCRSIGLLQSYTAVNGQGAGTVEIRPNNPGLVYRAGERLMIEVAATTRYPGYLHVAFVDKEGSVTHLVPGERVAAGQRITLGGRGEYQIGPPFGRDMIVAISSRQPLFDRPRSQSESAANYFAALDAALQRAAAGPAGDRPISRYVFITSVPAGQ